jgi:hypothetical protein
MLDSQHLRVDCRLLGSCPSTQQVGGCTLISNTTTRSQGHLLHYRDPFNGGNRDVGNHESSFNRSINVAYPESPSVTVPHINPAKGDPRFENNDLLYSTVHLRHELKTIPMISDLWALHSSVVAHLDSETMYFVMSAASGELSSFLFFCRCSLNEEKGCAPSPKAATFSMLTVARLWLALRVACPAFSPRLVPFIHHGLRIFCLLIS